MRFLSILMLGIIAQAGIFGQSRAELEEMRKKNLQEIEYFRPTRRGVKVDGKFHLNRIIHLLLANFQ